jgi:cytochrome c oxidase subunit II
MRTRASLKFLAIVVVFAFIWMWVRFPFELGHFVGKIFASPDAVDPATLHLSGEFVESNLGTAVEPDGSVTVRLIAQRFNFVPSCVLVPAGVSVRFRITSADVVHRFSFPDDARSDNTGGNRYNPNNAIEVVPGHVSESQIKFAQLGERSAPCHEFCGPGHFDMRSRIRVVANNQFTHAEPQERFTCAAP